MLVFALQYHGNRKQSPVNYIKIKQIKFKPQVILLRNIAAVNLIQF